MTPPAKKATKTEELTAKKSLPANGLKQSWKCVSSRTYHQTRNAAVRDGKTDEEAKALAIDAVAEDKKKYFASIVG